jgi:hypothetical protein
MTEYYMNFLKGEGFSPKADNDGDVIFKYEGKTYYVSVHSNDAHYFRLMFPNFWEVDSDVEMTKALRVANEINRKVKVATIIIQSNNHVSAVAEMFIENNPQLDQFFMRTLKVLKQSSDDFAQEMLGGSESLGLLAKLLK